MKKTFLYSVVLVLIFTTFFSFHIITTNAQANADTGLNNSTPANSDTSLTNSSPSSAQSTFNLTNPLANKVTSIGGLAQTFIDVISYILIIFAVLMLIWTGLQYILAQGNSERIKELHKQLLWIVVGIAIVIGARLIVRIVINTLQVTGTVNQSTLQTVKNAATGN